MVNISVQIKRKDEIGETGGKEMVSHWKQFIITYIEIISP
jgi:hypothetical protein